MTTFNFVPGRTSPFKFQPVLDGTTYTCVVPWNLFAQRYYMNLRTLSGTLVLARSVVSSSTPFSATGASWSGGQLTVSAPLGRTYSVGDVVRMTLSGFSPAACNGQFDCVVADLETLVADLPSDPGPITVIGNVSYDINLVGGYFSTSSLVFRSSTQQFEVTP